MNTGPQESHSPLYLGCCKKKEVPSHTVATELGRQPRDPLPAYPTMTGVQQGGGSDRGLCRGTLTEGICSLSWISKPLGFSVMFRAMKVSIYHLQPGKSGLMWQVA